MEVSPVEAGAILDRLAERVWPIDDGRPVTLTAAEVRALIATLNVLANGLDLTTKMLAARGPVH